MITRQLIAHLIGEGYRAPKTGSLLHIPVQAVRIEPGLAQHARDLIRSLHIGKKYAIVCDTQTYEILGRTIESALGSAAFPVILNNPKADKVTIKVLLRKTDSADTLIAVGSGTINDLCKYASFLDKKHYILFGTAPSMNGYGSANAAITVGGHKKTLPAHLPSAIYLDTDILAAAPIRLIRSGLGDTLCRSTAQADWLLSHHLLGTPYFEAPFTMIAEAEETLCRYAADLIKGNKELITLLAETLVLSGFGMVLAKGSYPASQGEHMIAHTMEMVHKDRLAPSYHGEQIGVTTLTMAALQHHLLQKKPHLIAKPCPDEAIIHYFGRDVGSECIKEMQKKQLTENDINRINDLTYHTWGNIHEALAAVMVPETTLRKALIAAGNPLDASSLGWEEGAYRQAVQHAVFSRSRFTFLDLSWLTQTTT